jgi:hypothetical protein
MYLNVGEVGLSLATNIVSAALAFRRTSINARAAPRGPRHYNAHSTFCPCGAHSFVRPAPRAFFRPDRNSRSRRAQGLSRLAASLRPPAGLGFDRHEHGGTFERIGLGACVNVHDSPPEPKPLLPLNPAASHPHHFANLTPAGALFSRAPSCKSDARKIPSDLANPTLGTSAS